MKGADCGGGYEGDTMEGEYSNADSRLPCSCRQCGNAGQAKIGGYSATSRPICDDGYVAGKCLESLKCVLENLGCIFNLVPLEIAL